MDSIDELAQSILARCASHGHSVAEVADRHAQEALRAELRRLARQWQLRIRTVARDDRVGVMRIDEQPWMTTNAPPSSGSTMHSATPSTNHRPRFKASVRPLPR